jgi:hypothetical protein
LEQTVAMGLGGAWGPDAERLYGTQPPGNPLELLREQPARSAAAWPG